MDSRAHAFKSNARRAVADERLRRALSRARSGFIDKRHTALTACSQFEAMRASARTVQEHTLSYLDWYLQRFETRLTERGGRMHWARDAGEACRLVAELAGAEDGPRVVKGKSMVAEEIGLNEALAAAGAHIVETDLGEYIIQLAEEPPSHIIAPAVHKTREDVVELFQRYHGPDPERSGEIPALVAEARRRLRRVFRDADVGITGANFLVAESGSIVLVTNEGNGDLASSLPKRHIVVTGIDKVVPSLNDANALLRVLGRSATGQTMTAYTSFINGPRGENDADGPERLDVVLVDNGRTRILGGPYREILHCIRCGACLNHCPIYAAVGGHSYGWAYSGPMGAVLNPLLLGQREAGDLPQASTLCGRCEAVCPVQIPLPRLLRQLREDQHRERIDSARSRWLLALWARIARRPRLYHALARVGVRLLRAVGRGRGALRRLPGAGGWTAARDLPLPAGRTFHELWLSRRKGRQE